MSHEPLPEDTFDAFLVEQLRNNEPYLPNDGFIEKTLLALPTVRRRRFSSNVYWLTGLLGMSVAAPALLSGVPLMFRWASHLTTTELIHVGLMSSAITLGAALLWSGRELDLI